MLQKLEPETRKECLGELVDAIKGLPYDPKNEYSFLISGVLLVSYTIRQKYLKKIWKKMDGIFSGSEI